MPVIVGTGIQCRKCREPYIEPVTIKGEPAAQCLKCGWVVYKNPGVPMKLSEVGPESYKGRSQTRVGNLTPEVKAARKRIGKWLQRLCHEQGIGTLKLSRQYDIPPSVVSQVFYGRLGDRSIESVAAALGVRVCDAPV